jgi:hypothetical protein
MQACSVMRISLGENVNICLKSLRYFRKSQWANVEDRLHNSNLLWPLCHWHFWSFALTTCLNDVKKLIELIRKGLVAFRSSFSWGLLFEWLCCNISSASYKNRWPESQVLSFISLPFPFPFLRTTSGSNSSTTFLASESYLRNDDLTVNVSSAPGPNSDDRFRVPAED